MDNRVAQARVDADIPQAELAELAGIDRTALSRAEKGERKLVMTEMVVVAEALGRPLGFFVNEPLPAVVSRRSDLALPHETTRAVDDEIELLASDAQMLLDMRRLKPVTRDKDARTPQTHSHAEQLAQPVREDLGIGDESILDLAHVCERLGLYTYAAPLGANGPDGGCVEVSGDTESVAVAVVNGDARSGRRRMALAHELGHWLCGDAYDCAVGERSREDDQLVCHPFPRSPRRRGEGLERPQRVERPGSRARRWVPISVELVGDYQPATEPEFDSIRRVSHSR